MYLPGDEVIFKRVHVRPKKKNTLFKVTRPTLFFWADPKNFFWVSRNPVVKSSFVTVSSDAAGLPLTLRIVAKCEFFYGFCNRW